MTTKTRYCDECEHWQEINFRRTTPCSLGHKPRFYRPTDDPHHINWGWKRRCEDFKEKRDDHPANP